MLVRVTRESQRYNGDDIVIIHTRLCNETGSGQWKPSTAFVSSHSSSIWHRAVPHQLSWASYSSFTLKLCFTLFKHKPTYIHLYKWYTSSSAPLHPGEINLNITTRMAPERCEDLRLKPNSCFILSIVQQYSFIATVCCLMYARLQELQGRGHPWFLYVYTVPTTTT